MEKKFEIEKEIQMEKEFKMTIVSALIEAFNNLLKLCNKVADAADPVKHVQNIEALTNKVDETYEKMREIIVNDQTLSADEKLERLDKIAQSQMTARQTCDEAIKGNRENVSKIVGEVLLAFTTCGISYIPKVVRKKQEKLLEENNKTLVIEDAESPALIAENTEA